MGGLDRSPRLVLLAEITSARNLLAYGIRAVRSAPLTSTTLDPILSLLAIGAEKLLKITLGLISLDNDGTWPSKDAMRKFGHNVDELYAAAIGALRERSLSATPYVQSLLAEVEGDALLQPILAALTCYGSRGRFYYLDQLASDPQDAASPEEFWRTLELSAMESPEVAAAYSIAYAAPGDQRAWDAARKSLNSRIAFSIEQFWEAIAVCGRNNVLGSEGVVFGFEVHPDVVGSQ